MEIVLVESKLKARRGQSRHQRRSNRTRAKLIEAARAVFVEKGIDRTTVDDITKRADVGRGTFYYHFENIGDLASEIIREMLAELVAAIESKCLDQTELADVLDAMIGVHLEFFSQRWEDFVMFYLGRADLTLVESYEGMETPFIDYLYCIENLVDSAISQPIPRPMLRRLACAVAGFISGYYSFAVIASEGEDVDKPFMSLRSAFVASLVRFIKEAIPDERKRRH